MYCRWSQGSLPQRPTASTLWLPTIPSSPCPHSAPSIHQCWKPHFLASTSTSTPISTLHCWYLSVGTIYKSADPLDPLQPSNYIMHLELHLFVFFWGITSIHLLCNPESKCSSSPPFVLLIFSSPPFFLLYSSHAFFSPFTHNNVNIPNPLRTLESLRQCVVSIVTCPHTQLLSTKQWA